MTISTQHQAEPPSVARAAALWTGAGFVLYLLGWMASILGIGLLENVLFQPLGLRPEAGTLGLSLQNGIHQVVWGVLVVAIATPLGRRLVHGIRFTAHGWALLAAGLAIAMVAEALGNEFVRARYEYYDMEYQGLTIFTAPALVATALATWAALAVPPQAVAMPAIAALTAAGGFAVSLLPSIPGAADGIATGSIPLVGSFLVGVAYVLVAVIAVIRHVADAGLDQGRR